jgi:hypothetical protein
MSIIVTAELVRDARNEALEEAAAICESVDAEHKSPVGGWYLQNAAKAIRALKSSSPTQG